MPVTTDRVIEFAMEALRRHVEDLLDDPSWLLDEAGIDPVAYLAEQRQIAADLGFDYDALVEEIGSEYEIARLRNYEAGNFQRMPLR